MEDFYVYIYLDPRKPGNFCYGNLKFNFEPFYVGKGRRNRCYHGLKPYKEYEKRWHKFRKIEKINKEGYTPIIIKLYENISDEKSKQKEIEIIKLIGRCDFNQGPLTNHTDGGEGTININPEWRKVLSKPVQQYKNDKLIAEYDSIKDACNTTGLIPQNVGAAANGKYKTSGGFVWKYKNKEDVLQGHLKSKVQMPKHSDATKSKMRRRKTSNITKQKMSDNSSIKLTVIQIDENDKHIQSWDSITRASQTTGIPINKIRRSCQGRFTKIIERFIWGDPIRQHEAIKTHNEIMKVKQKNRLRINQIKNGILIKEWDFLTQVKEGGFSHHGVTKQCKAGGGMYKGFYWEYSK